MWPLWLMKYFVRITMNYCFPWGLALSDPQFTEHQLPLRGDQCNIHDHITFNLFSFHQINKSISKFKLFPPLNSDISEGYKTGIWHKALLQQIIKYKHPLFVMLFLPNSVEINLYYSFVHACTTPYWDMYHSSHWTLIVTLLMNLRNFFEIFTRYTGFQIKERANN